MDQKLVSRLEAVTLTLEKLVNQSSTKSNSSCQEEHEDSASVTAFDELLSLHLTPVSNLGSKIGGLVNDQFVMVEKVVQVCKHIVNTATNSKRPTQEALQGLIAPLQSALEQVGGIKDKNRASSVFSVLNCIADGVGAFGWVVVDPAPCPYIESMKESALFYSNKVVKEFKDKDANMVAFVQGFMSFLLELKLYVKKYHTTGLVWNPKGGDASNSKIEVKQPVNVPAVQPNLSITNPTAGLRKVDPSQMTHKNPELRQSSVVAANANTTTEKEVAKNVVKAVVKPSKLELQGNKWIVENYVNNAEICVSGVELKHVVYIYNCVNCTVKIDGKVNAITADACKKTGLLVTSVVSTIDLINCKQIKLQITGSCPTISVDKSDALELYVSKESLGVEVFSAKSSGVNVLFEEKEEWVEKAVCEQFKTVIKGGELVSVAVEHKG